MRIGHLTGVICTCLLTLFTSNVRATLVDNGNGLIYDEDLDITWLADANIGGNLTWDEANTWADSLTVGGATDWRLPTADTCTATPCSAEFNHLFYNELGGSTGVPLTGDVGLFSNIQGVYWTIQERDSGSAWIFYFGNSTLAGKRDWAFKDGDVAVWAVHDGDVSTVPIPAAIWLFGSGLLTLLGITRRRRAA
jgi:hypothetical protein